MADLTHAYDLDPVMVHKVEYFAHFLRRSLRLSEDDYQDYRQELYLHAIRRTPEYDPTKSGWATFMECVLHAQAITILRRHKFRSGREIPISGCGGFDANYAYATRLDGAPLSDDREWAAAFTHGAETDSIDIAIVINDALAALAPHLQRVARLLMTGHRTSDIARELQMPYTSVHHQVKRVRQLLAAQGITFLPVQVRNFAESARKRDT
ncbi:MAG: sigma-70 RNA polymerase sigma factor region 4 domain-containing protein [Armatimonadota bacterium]